MAYVTLEFLSSELLERAVQAVTRSRELCANTSRLIKERIASSKRCCARDSVYPPASRAR